MQNKKSIIWGDVVKPKIGKDKASMVQFGNPKVRLFDQTTSIDPTLLRLAPPLQYCFRDKDTGLPLSGGFVYFYQDNSHTTLRNVYIRTNLPPPNPEFTVAANPQILTAFGTFLNVLYMYPFDENNSSIIQKYYVEVFNSFRVPQF